MARTRADDERLLRWIRARCAGFSAAKIAAVEGVPKGTVTSATENVMRDDLAMSGERNARAGYWRSRRGPGPA